MRFLKFSLITLAVLIIIGLIVIRTYLNKIDLESYQYWVNNKALQIDEPKRQIILPNPLIDSSFWAIIDQGVNLKSGMLNTDTLAIILAKEPEKIIPFELTLRRKLSALNTFDVLAACKISQLIVSDDTFLYFRCWLIWKGKEATELAINNINAIPKVVPKGPTVDDLFVAEGLLYVSEKAAEINRTNENIPFYCSPIDTLGPRDLSEQGGEFYDLGEPIRGQNFLNKELKSRYSGVFSDWSSLWIYIMFW